MYFEAQVNSIKYSVVVQELSTAWSVEIREEKGSWEKHLISKKHYQYLDDTLSFIFENSSYLVDVIGSDTRYMVYTRGSHRTVNIFNEEMILHESLKSKGSLGQHLELKTGMPGKVVKLFVKEGEEVKKGQPILIIEAMKMENEMTAPQDCKVKKIHVKKNNIIETGTTLVSFGLK